MTDSWMDFTAPAVITPDGEYRYLLTRDGWLAPEDAGPLVVIGLNPSTANAADDDATVSRLRHRAMRDAYLGRNVTKFSRLVVVNLFALRSRDPGRLGRHPDPVGHRNDAWLLGAASIPGAVVVAAWGADPAAQDRAPQVVKMITQAGVTLYCLGWTRDRAPRHPLYVPAAAQLEVYRKAAA